MSYDDSSDTAKHAEIRAGAVNRALRDACALTLSRQLPRPVFVHPAVAQSMVGFGEYRGEPWVFVNQTMVVKDPPAVAASFSKTHGQGGAN